MTNHDDLFNDDDDDDNDGDHNDDEDDDDVHRLSGEVRRKKE